MNYSPFYRRVNKTINPQGVAALLSLSLVAGVAHGARPTTAWSKVNTQSGDFYDATLWSTGLPSNVQDAIIDNGGTAVISAANATNITYVFIGSQQNTSGTLNVVTGGTARFTSLSVGVLNATGNLNISGGGKLETFGGAIGSDYLGVGHANLTGTGSNWKVTGDEMVIGGNGTGNLTVMSGANVNVGNGTGKIQLGIHPLAEGNIYLGNGGTSGTITADQIYNGQGRGAVIFNHTNSAFNFSTKLFGTKTVNGYLAVIQRGTGTTVMSGISELAGGFKSVTVNGENKQVIMPAVTVESGTLLVTGQINGSFQDIVDENDMIIGQEEAAGEILVKAGGTLGGTGSIKGKATNQGTISPGGLSLTVGVLSFGGALDLRGTDMNIYDSELPGPGKVKFELGGRVRGTSYDGLNVLGMLSYGGVLEIALLNGFLPVAGDVFDLFQGFSGSEGSFSSVVFNSGEYISSFNASTGDLTIIAVPEPTVCGLTAFAVVTLGFARRNRGMRRSTS